MHDFSAGCWKTFDSISPTANDAVSTLPTIQLDLWFSVKESDLHRAIDLLPNLSWAGSLVGMRVELAPKDTTELLKRFREAYAEANKELAEAETTYRPWPKTLTDYLSEELKSEYALKYYVLNPEQFDNFKPKDGYEPAEIKSDKGRSGSQILNSLVRVDCLSAQRHLSDQVGSRVEEISKCLSRFYSRNLQQRENDFTALRALAESETQLNDHLARVFAPTLEQLSALGYPGLANPKLLIKSALNPATIMSSQDARVHYALGNDGDNTVTLPDNYNGLGFKNLIYMVVEILDRHSRWLEQEEDRPPLHILCIEEPEAHLHAQLQQAFIRKVLDLLKLPAADAEHYGTQVVVTTHSPHILYERGFKPIRYFRRSAPSALYQYSEVLNLSVFYNSTEPTTRDFLQRYMKLTHCDLFFADAAILVEGNVERLLLPQMILRVATELTSTYISILEVGGAFAHRFKTLIEFLGIGTLIITDIDSVTPRTAAAGAQAAGDDDDADDEEDAQGKACIVSQPDAVTANQALVQWLPKKNTIAELIASSKVDCTQAATDTSSATVFVAFQRPRDITWRGETKSVAGRTLEEDFALENLAWTQNVARKGLRLRIPKNDTITLDELVGRIHKRVQSSSFNKTEFALGVIAADPASWNVPQYIADGLRWLKDLMIASRPELTVVVTEKPPAPANDAAPATPMAEVV